MIDCAELNNCAIPMSVQYLIVFVAFVLFAVKCFHKRDPYDRM